MFLRQTRRANMPDATNPFASGLAGARITGKGIERVAVVLNLVPIGIRDDGQLPRERGRARRRA